MRRRAGKRESRKRTLRVSRGGETWLPVVRSAKHLTRLISDGSTPTIYTPYRDNPRACSFTQLVLPLHLRSTVMSTPRATKELPHLVRALNTISRTAAPPSAPGAASRRPPTRCPRPTTAPSALGSAGSSGPRRRLRPGCTTVRWVSSTGATLSRRCGVSCAGWRRVNLSVEHAVYFLRFRAFVLSRFRVGSCPRSAPRAIQRPFLCDGPLRMCIFQLQTCVPVLPRVSDFEPVLSVSRRRGSTRCPGGTCRSRCSAESR